MSLLRAEDTAIQEISLKNKKKALTGVSFEEFLIIIPVFSEHYEKPAWEEYMSGKRKRKPGGGRKGNLNAMKEKLFFILYYLKNYQKFDVIGYDFGFDKSAAHYNVNKSKRALLSALAESGVLPKRRFSGPEEMEEAFKIQEIYWFFGFF